MLKFSTKLYWRAEPLYTLASTCIKTFSYINQGDVIRRSERPIPGDRYISEFLMMYSQIPMNGNNDENKQPETSTNPSTKTEPNRPDPDPGRVPKFEEFWRKIHRTVLQSYGFGMLGVLACEWVFSFPELLFWSYFMSGFAAMYFGSRQLTKIPPSIKLTNSTTGIDDTQSRKIAYWAMILGTSTWSSFYLLLNFAVAGVLAPFSFMGCYYFIVEAHKSALKAPLPNAESHYPPYPALIIWMAGSCMAALYMPICSVLTLGVGGVVYAVYVLKRLWLLQKKITADMINDYNNGNLDYLHYSRVICLNAFSVLATIMIGLIVPGMYLHFKAREYYSSFDSKKTNQNSETTNQQ